MVFSGPHINVYVNQRDIRGLALISELGEQLWLATLR